MNVLDVLHDDHAVVERLFSEILRTPSSDRAGREHLFHELRDAFLKHAHAEETVFYPTLRDKKPSHDLIEHGLDEHHEVERMMAGMDFVPADSDDWIDRLETVRAKVKDHVEEEEGGVFPKARQLLGEGELTRMTERFLRSKEREGRPT